MPVTPPQPSRYQYYLYVKLASKNRPDGRCVFKPWIPAFAGMTT